MKHLITFIVLSLYLSTITAQNNIVGNWTTGWQTNASTCCVPSGIEITQVNNTYQASFTFPQNYYLFFNIYCLSNGITGNFIENFTFLGNISLPIGSATVENINMWNNTNSTINITSATFTSSIGTSLGPFYGVYIGGCNYNIIPSNSSSASIETYSSDFTGSYTSITSVKGFNSSSNQSSNTCCTPSSVSIQFLGNLPYINLTATFLQANLSNNAWCSEGDINDTIVNQYYGVAAYESNLTWWAAASKSYQIIMDANSPGYIIGNFYGASNSICSFNMSLVNFGGKLAITSVVGIISLLMISLL